MKVSADHLPPNTDFDLFVTQVPNVPFGISWYQGDLESNRSGHARGTFIGRFNIETFAVAPGSAAAPQVFNGPFPDASLNPPFNPVQMYHLGPWFNSPKDAAAGCAGTITPFNGEHDAGVQALSTSNFPDQAGPPAPDHILTTNNFRRGSSAAPPESADKAERARLCVHRKASRRVMYAISGCGSGHAFVH
jgi:hypothetical protein